jgi:L-seryl-tRNA(Ser) seleniumtransferase
LSSALELLPYARGEILRSTADDVAKLRAAWRIVAARRAEGTLFNFTGLERSLDVEPDALAYMDDDLAPALVGERLTELALEHLGGERGRDDVFVANRLTAAAVAAMQVLVEPGMRVVGVSPSYTHPAIVRAVRLAGGDFDDDAPNDDADLVVITRLAVTYDLMPLADVQRAVDAARDRGVRVFVDDAGGARVGPAVFGQPRTLELGADVGATGLDKYGTTGPRLGLLAGRAELLARIRARAIELGLEARPMLYPAVVSSLERYRPERVRALVAATNDFGDALEARLGAAVSRTPVAVKLEAEAIVAEAVRRAGLQVTDCYLVPYEATAALAMLLLRDHGVLTVHFAALPPGTSDLLFKFLPPETMRDFGGAARLAEAVDRSLDALATLIGGAAGVAGVAALLKVG